MQNKFCRVPLAECTRTLVDVAMGRKSADLVIRGAKLVNVCTGEVLDGYDVAVSCGRIAAIGDVSASVGEGTPSLTLRASTWHRRSSTGTFISNLRC